MSEEQKKYGDPQGTYAEVQDTIRECNRPVTVTPNPTTAHVAIENAIDVIIDLRDEVAKLRRTLAAQELPAGGGITDEFLERFSDMMEWAYPVRGKNESVESWRERLGPLWGRLRHLKVIVTAFERRRQTDMDAAFAEFDQTIRQGGVLRG